MEDAYDRFALAKKKDREEHDRKIRGAFLCMHGKNEAFEKDKLSYGEKKKLAEKKAQKETKVNKFPHDAEFKPSHPPRKGVLGTLGKFPPYEKDPMKIITKKVQEKDKEPFKPNHGGNLSRPTPTISCNAINIRKEIHH